MDQRFSPALAGYSALFVYEIVGTRKYGERNEPCNDGVTALKTNEAPLPCSSSRLRGGNSRESEATDGQAAPKEAKKTLFISRLVTRYFNRSPDGG